MSTLTPIALHHAVFNTVEQIKKTGRNVYVDTLGSCEAQCDRARVPA